MMAKHAADVRMTSRSLAEALRFTVALTADQNSSGGKFGLCRLSL